MGLIKEIILDTLTDWPLGTIIGILICIVILIIAGLILHGIFIAVDSWFLPRYSDTGIVISRNYYPAYSTTTFMLSGKVMVPVTTFHSEAWSLAVNVDGKSDIVYVDKYFFESNPEGNEIKVEYVHGRISDKIYIKACSKI